MRYILLLPLIVFLGCLSKKTEENQNSKIGTKSFKWKDSERVDSYYGGNRLLNVQIWYPAIFDEQIKQYANSQYYYEIDNAYKSLENWTDEDYQFVSKIPTKSFINCPISEKQSKYPVLLLSPSLGGNISMYTYYAEKLAKCGFVVVGINHLYESEYVIDNNMNIIPVDLAFHDSLKTLDIPEQITAEKYREVKGIRQKVLGEDLVYCISKLEEINTDEFEGRLDLEKIGAFGHSIGGAASIYASLLDKRIKAVLNIDGTPPTAALESGITVPFMFIEDLTDYENHEGYKKMHQRRAEFCEINSSESFRILIGGTNHNSFLDINYHTASNESEKEKALDVLNQTTDYMLQFFNHYLKQDEISLGETKTDSLEIIKFEKK